jgi:predicted MFS family arabinose efflux permease
MFVPSHRNSMLTWCSSEDPNDPLNWPQSKKLIVTSIVGFGAVLYAAVLAPLLSPALVVIALEFKVDVADITVISGYMLLVTACSGPIICALSRKYGKRLILVLSSLFGLIGTIIGSATNTYDGLMAARVVQGFSMYTQPLHPSHPRILTFSLAPPLSPSSSP